MIIGKALDSIVIRLPKLSEVNLETRLPAINPGEDIAANHEISFWK